MKRNSLTLAALGAAVAANAFAATVEVEGLNVLGYTEIDSRSAYLPIAIPYHEAASVNGIPITVADVVMTAPLSPGDRLYAYDHEKKVYDTYVLEQDPVTKAKTWTPSAVTTITLAGVSTRVSTDAKQAGLATGYGFWLQRFGESTNSVVQVMGQLATDITVTVGAGEYALLGVVSDTDLDLASSAAAENPFAGKAAVGDRIEIPQADGSLEIYACRATGWKALRRGASLAKIKTGTAFWYLRAERAEAMTVSWTL